MLINRGMAKNRPSPYGIKGAASRSAGACPPRSLHGEGQALALREADGSEIRGVFSSKDT